MYSQLCPHPHKSAAGATGGECRGDTPLRAYAGAGPHPPPPSGRTTYRNDCSLIETWAPHDTAMARRVCPRQLRRVCPGHHTVCPRHHNLCPRRHNPPSPVSTSPSAKSATLLWHHSSIVSPSRSLTASHQLPPALTRNRVDAFRACIFFETDHASSCRNRTAHTPRSNVSSPCELKGWLGKRCPVFPTAEGRTEIARGTKVDVRQQSDLPGFQNR